MAIPVCRFGCRVIVAVASVHRVVRRLEVKPASRLSIVCGSLLTRRGAVKVPAFDPVRIMIMQINLSIFMCMTVMLMTVEIEEGMK